MHGFRASKIIHDRLAKAEYWCLIATRDCPGSLDLVEDVHEFVGHPLEIVTIGSIGAYIFVPKRDIGAADLSRLISKHHDKSVKPEDISSKAIDIVIPATEMGERLAVGLPKLCDHWKKVSHRN